MDGLLLAPWPRPSLPPCCFLVDLTRRGLEAHLQEVVLEQMVQEQLTHFERTLRDRLMDTVRRITIGHVVHMRDVLRFRDEIAVKVDVDFQDVQNGHPEDAA